MRSTGRQIEDQKARTRSSRGANRRKKNETTQNACHRSETIRWESQAREIRRSIVPTRPHFPAPPLCSPRSHAQFASLPKEGFAQTTGHKKRQRQLRLPSSKSSSLAHERWKSPRKPA